MKKTGILFITALLFVSMAFVGCKKSEAAATEETVVQEETVVEPAVEEAVVADEAATMELKVGTYRYFMDIESKNLDPETLLK